MLEQAHFLLTYGCPFECDHCFVYSSPDAVGTFRLAQIRAICDELAKMETVDTVYFEGGEPFLYYGAMLEAIRLAHGHGFRTGIVTNGYWATSEEDARAWLRPLAEEGLGHMYVSDDPYHYEENGEEPKHALRAAEALGIPCEAITIEEPRGERGEKGEPIVGGDVRFRGRAVEKLLDDLPRRPWTTFTECPDEELASPTRVHLDSFGNVELCQGLSMGNLWETPLSELVAAYDPDAHPIAGPIHRSGPAALVEAFGTEPEDGYVDACHLCYLTRLALLDKFPEVLAPRQCYGLPQD